jgi:hypothetical protein
MNTEVVEMNIKSRGAESFLVGKLSEPGAPNMLHEVLYIKPAL